MKALRRFALLLVLIALVPVAVAVPTANQDVPRTGLDREIIYFVMPDRYRNGDLSNDAGPGFNPTHTAFFHGGDIRGLTGNCSDDDGLARIKGLGFTAVWLTPLVAQQPPTPGGAGYHGYWGVDFLRVEPQLGTQADLLALRDCANRLGLKLILDVVTNHTGDIVWYEGKRAYIPERFKDLKNPAWLNDLSNYHNTGDISSCWSANSCTRDGDFYGLDDLATEKENVYRGWGEVYGEWIKRYGFAAFRVDTARHLDTEFFKRWSPLIHQAASQAGINDFTIFGEVWEQSAIELMRYVRINKMQTALDFPLQRVAVDFAAAASDAQVLANVFDYDDYYTSANSSAQNLVTFLGNHDMGRVALLIKAARNNPDSESLPRTKLAHALLYLTRGVPVVYYGDEVGMTGSGSGKDQLARQDMFATQVTQWRAEPRVGSDPVGSGDSFALKDHPIAAYLRKLAKLRTDHPALANGQMQIRYSKGPVFVFSKRAPDDAREYLVALNNSKKAVRVSIPTASQGGWDLILGSARYDASGNQVVATLAPMEATVLRAKQMSSAPRVKLGALKFKTDFLSGFYRVLAPVDTQDLATAEFLIKRTGPWSSLGVDLNRPFRAFIDPEEFNGALEIKAIVRDAKGRKYESKSITVNIPAP